MYGREQALLPAELSRDQERLPDSAHIFGI
jgi:hypothetical protein